MKAEGENVPSLAEYSHKLCTIWKKLTELTGADKGNLNTVPT